jgi:hypothetical protein
MRCSAQRADVGWVIATFGGVSSIAAGLVLADLAWESMWPWGAFVPWVAPQQLLSQWVVGCLFVGGVLLLGGARAAGTALVGSSAFSFLAFLLSGLYGGDHLETLVHGAVILGSLGLVGFGLAGLALGAHAPLGRYPMALALGAFATVVVGTLLILRIHAEAAPTCSLIDARPVTNASSPFAASCFRGFEDPWVQAVLAFNVAFLALLFLVPAWRASRSWGEHEEDDSFVDWGVYGRSGRGGTPFLL